MGALDDAVIYLYFDTHLRKDRRQDAILFCSKEYRAYVVRTPPAVHT